MTKILLPTKPPVRGEPAFDPAIIAQDVATIRAACPALQDHTDEMVEALWRWFSVTDLYSGWHSPPSHGLLDYAIGCFEKMDQRTMDEAMEYL